MSCVKDVVVVVVVVVLVVVAVVGVFVTVEHGSVTRCG